MNRSLKDSFADGSIMAGSQHRKGRSTSGVIRDTDENLDLFSRNCRSLSATATDESDASFKLWRLSVGSAKPASNGTDDLLSSEDGGKHDYDWLLTPPGTPLVSSLNASEPQSTLMAPRSSSSLRSVSITKASRLSATHSENSSSSRPIRSSSVTRPSISSVVHNNYSSNSNRSSILNTSSLSVTSSRPSTPTSRSSSTARPLTSSVRPVQSRSSTPAKSLPAPTISYGEKARVNQTPRPSTPTASPQTPGNISSISARSNSRPSTPTARPQTPGNISSISARSNSRPSTPTARPQTPGNLSTISARSNSRASTPTRRTLTPAPAPSLCRSLSVGRVLPNSRHPAIASRGTSPGPHARTPQKPIVPPDFPHETPPNLRTTLPDRPLSACRSRPGIGATVRGNSEASGPVNPSRRQPSPMVTRGRLPEISGRGRLHANGHDIGAPESQKTPPVLEPSMRKLAKSATATENTGFGRTISKKSLDMALRHMDIRNGTGSIRSLSGTTIFPQSIRSSAPKFPPARALRTSSSVSSNSDQPVSSNGSTTENGNQSLDGEAEESNGRATKLSEPDIFETSQYEAILLKEDSKNTNWLHSADDTSDQGLIFDHRFEQLPELFGLI